MTDNRTLWRLLIVHLAFVGIGAGLLAVDAVAVRYAVWSTVVGYNLFLPAYFFRSGDREVVDLWAFLLPLSLLQVLPDWYLSAVQQTLVFPTASDTFPVPLFMAGLWTLPLMVTTAFGIWVAWRWGTRLGYAAAIAAGLLVFGTGELALTRVGVWQARDVTAVGGIAVYILPAELSLVAATLYAYRSVREASFGHRLVAAAGVAIFYLGAAATSFLLVETAG